jgi:polysaccharide export outer membrane protein
MQPGKLGASPWCLATAAFLGLMAAGNSACAQTIIGTPQETNDRIKALSSKARVTPHDYIIGSGDTLTIEVFDVKEFTRDVRVSQTGTIGLPLLPMRLQVRGLTETQAEQKIAEVLIANGLVSHPEVTVSVKDRKSKPVTVVGAVAHPLVFQADRPVTLLEVLAEAGGIANDAGDTAIVTRPTDQASLDAYGISAQANNTNDDVIPPTGQNNSASKVDPTQPVAGIAPTTPAPGNKPVFRDGGPPEVAATTEAPIPTEAPALSNTITVNLNELMESGNATNNIILQAGDIVTVPHAGIVYVLGSVGRPGGFVLANDRTHMTTLKMLALAGGLTRTAKSDKAVIIRKDSQGQQHEVNVDLKKVQQRKAEDVQLQASDILYVPDSIGKRALIKAGEIALATGTSVAFYRLGSY